MSTPTGPYTVTLTDAAGNTGSAQVTLKAPQPVVTPPPPPPPPTITVARPLVGATLNPNAWSPTTSLQAAYANWTTVTGHAAESGKIYWTPPWPTKAGGSLLAYSQMGMIPIVCFDHIPSTDASWQTDLAAAIKMIATVHKRAYIVLNQEGNNPHYTAAEHAAWIGIQKAGFKVVTSESPFQVLYCPSAMRPDQVDAGYPGPTGCHGIAPDHYCTSADPAPVWAEVVKLCHQDHLPAGTGWLEMGVSASGGTITVAQLNAYLGFAQKQAQTEYLGNYPTNVYAWWNGGSAPTKVDNTIVPITANKANAGFAQAWGTFAGALTSLSAKKA